MSEGDVSDAETTTSTVMVGTEEIKEESKEI